MTHTTVHVVTRDPDGVPMFMFETRGLAEECILAIQEEAPHSGLALTVETFLVHRTVKGAMKHFVEE